MGYICKVIFNALLQRVYAPDVRRYREERCRYSITCMSSVSPAANDLNDIDRPRRLFSSDYALDLWAEFCKSLIFSKFQRSPAIHAAYNKQFFELSRHLSYRPYMRSISKHFAKVFKPTDALSPRLWTGSSSCTSSAETLISIAGIALMEFH